MERGVAVPMPVVWHVIAHPVHVLADSIPIAFDVVDPLWCALVDVQCLA